MPELRIQAQYPTDETLQKLDRMAQDNADENIRLLAQTLAAISRSVIAIGDWLANTTFVVGDSDK